MMAMVVQIAHLVHVLVGQEFALGIASISFRESSSMESAISSGVF